MVTRPTTVRDDGGQGSQGSEERAHSDRNNDRPVPSFWNFVENEPRHEGFANNNHHPFERMQHHA